MVDLKVGVSSVREITHSLEKHLREAEMDQVVKNLGHFELDTLSCYLFIEQYRQCFQICRMTRRLEVLLSGY